MTDSSVAQKRGAPITLHRLSPATESSLTEANRCPGDAVAVQETTVGPHDTPTENSLGRSGNLRFGEYELIEEIARGGMGIIYRAKQTGLNRLVALKVILAGPAAPEADLQRFRAEAEVAARLDHPHIVPVHAVGVQDGWHYYSMKLVEGGNLAHRLAYYLKNPHAAVKLLVQIAHAVQHAHDQGIVHRDLKPSNILLDQRLEPFLTDFGLALSWEVPTPSATPSSAGLPQSKTDPSSQLPAQPDGIVGTPSYMAPEQATGKPCGNLPAVDIHSLGAILYQMLTGRPPFRGETAVETLLKTVHNEAPSPSRFNAAIDPQLEAVCLMALRKKPTERYPSARAFADDLERWLEGRPTWAGRRRRELIPAASSFLPRWKNLLMAGAATALAALMIAWIIRSFVDGRKANAGDEPTRVETTKPSPAPLPQPFLVGWDHLTDPMETVAEAALSLALTIKQAYADQQEYRQRLDDARQALRQNDPKAAAERLAACPIASRGWEWRHLHHLSQLAPVQGRIPESAWTLADPKGFAGVAVNGDAHSLGWTNADGDVRVWDQRRRKVCFELPAKLGSIWGVGLAPDGSRLAAAGSDGLWIFDTVDGELLHSLKGHRGVIYHALFHPEGKWLATCGHDKTVRFWNAKDGKQLALCGPFQSVPRDMSFSADGKWLGVAVDTLLILFDAKSGSEVERLECFDGAVDRFAFSPDQHRLALTAGRYVRVHDLRTGDLVQSIDSGLDRVRLLAFSPDSQRLIAAGKAELVILNPRSPLPLLSLSVGEGTLGGLGFDSHDESLYATVLGDEAGGIRRWAVKPDASKK